MQEGDFYVKYFNQSDKSFLEECVKVHKDGDKWYPMRCLIFNTPEIGSHLAQSGDWRYVGITMKRDVPFITQIDFHERQKSNCPTAITSDLQMQVMTPRRELYMRYNTICFIKFCHFIGTTFKRIFSTFRDTLMQMQSETFVSTYDKACNEEQTTMVNNCINDLIYQKMNCSLPWTNQTGNVF